MDSASKRGSFIGRHDCLSCVLWPLDNAPPPKKKILKLDGTQRKLSSFVTTNTGATVYETESAIDHEAEGNNAAKEPDETSTSDTSSTPASAEEFQNKWLAFWLVLQLLINVTQFIVESVIIITQNCFSSSLVSKQCIK